MKKIILGLFLFVSAIGAAQPGTLDPTFNSLGTGANNAVLSTAVQTDHKIIIGGQFTNYNGTTKNRLARLNADGTLDSSFLTLVNNPVYAIAIQNDGKIVFGGGFSSVNGTTGINRIARLNPDGSNDTSFNVGLGANGLVYSIKIQTNGKIILSGDFTSYNGVSRKSIARLNVDGSLDVSFDPGTGADNIISKTEIQKDGKIIIAGQFTSYNGTTINRIARLNANGSLDISFNPGTGANNLVRGIALQSDGKIVIAGQFTTFNAIGKGRIVRLNTDGTVDASFNIGSGFNGVVLELAIQNDGKIIAGGYFTAYKGVTANKIALLNSDGSANTSFNSGTGADDIVLAFASQSFGKIIICGNFTEYNGSLVNRIARIGADENIIVNMTTPNNTMLPLLSTAVYAETYSYPTGVKTYRFSITNNVTNETQEVLTTKRFVAIPFSMRQFGATYSIKASAVIDGELVPYAGNTITVSTPYEATVKLASNSCGATVSHITNVYRENAQGATATKFNIYDATGTNLIGSVQTSNNYFRFSEIAFEFGATYIVKVQVEIDGVFGAEGEACNVTIATPTTTLASFSCGATVSPIAANVYAINVLGATGYIFNIYDATGDNLIGSLDKSTNYFRFNEIAYVAGASYMVRVQVKRDAVIGEEGAACKVILTGMPAAPTRVIETPFAAVAYPNPFANSFSLDVKSSNKSQLDIKVYDMLGRLVEQKSADINDLEMVTIGVTYPAGIYNVMVTQHNQTKAVRVVKR